MFNIDGFDEVLGLVIARLGISKDNELEVKYIAAEIGQRILHFCNRKDMPIELYLTWSSMVKDYIESEREDLLPGYDPDHIDLLGLNLSIGDTSVGGKGSSANDKKSIQTRRKEKAIENLISNYQIDLIRRRKMRF